MQDGHNQDEEHFRVAAHLLREADEVGCFGLLRGKAIREKTGTRIDASAAVRADGPFVCPRCGTPAIVRKDQGGGRVDHFAHFAPLTPLIPSGETDIHKAAKNEICNALKKAFPEGNWEVERPITKSKKLQVPTLVPDISGRVGNDRQALVIEVQWSTISLAAILKRSKGYHRRKLPVLWILPLKKPLPEEFRPRSFERYLHTMYFGRVYYWQPGLGLNVILHITFPCSGGLIRESGSLQRANSRVAASIERFGSLEWPLFSLP